MAASGFCPLFKPQSSWGGPASCMCPASLSAPLMLQCSDLCLCLCLPSTTHLLIVCWLKGWSGKHNSTHPTWSPGNPHIGDAGPSFHCLSDKTGAQVPSIWPSILCASRARSCTYRGKCRAGHCPRGGHIWDKPGLSHPGLHCSPASTLTSVPCVRFPCP